MVRVIKKIRKILPGIGLQQSILKQAVIMIIPGINHLREATVILSHPSIKDARDHF
jgi:hypothetical protein